MVLVSQQGQSHTGEATLLVQRPSSLLGSCSPPVCCLRLVRVTDSRGTTPTQGGPTGAVAGDTVRCGQRVGQLGLVIAGRTRPARTSPRLRRALARTSAVSVRRGRSPSGSCMDRRPGSAGMGARSFASERVDSSGQVRRSWRPWWRRRQGWTATPLSHGGASGGRRLRSRRWSRRYPPGMALRAWSNRMDRRAQERWRRPHVAPAYLGMALVFALYGLLVASSPVLPLTFATVSGLMSTVAWLARRQGRR